MVPCRFQNCWALINDFVADFYLSLSPSFLQEGPRTTRERQNENICVTLGAT